MNICARCSLQVSVMFTLWLNCFKCHIQSFNLHVRLVWGRSDMNLPLFIFSQSPNHPTLLPLFKAWLSLQELLPQHHSSVDLNQPDTCILSEMTSAALWQDCSKPLISSGWRLLQLSALSPYTNTNVKKITLGCEQASLHRLHDSVQLGVFV